VNRQRAGRYGGLYFFEENRTRPGTFFRGERHVDEIRSRKPALDRCGGHFRHRTHRARANRCGRARRNRRHRAKTANRTSVSTWPIAVTASGGEALERRGITNVQGLEGSSPNLHTSPTPGNSTAAQIAIRGSVTANPGAHLGSPAVGMYVDGVYVGKTQGALFHLIRNRSRRSAAVVRRARSGVEHAGRRLQHRHPQTEWRGERQRDGRHRELTPRAAARWSIDFPTLGAAKINLALAAHQRDGWVSNKVGNAPTPPGRAASTSDLNNPDTEERATRDRRAGFGRGGYRLSRRLQRRRSKLFVLATLSARPCPSSRPTCRKRLATERAPPSTAPRSNVRRPKVILFDDRLARVRHGTPFARSPPNANPPGRTALISHWPRRSTLRVRSVCRITVRPHKRTSTAGSATAAACDTSPAFTTSKTTATPTIRRPSSQTSVLAVGVRFKSQYGFTTKATGGLRAGRNPDQRSILVHGGLRYTNETKTIARCAGLVGIFDYVPCLTRAEKSFNATTPLAVLTWKPDASFSGYLKYAEGFKSGGFNGEAGDPANPDPGQHRAGSNAVLAGRKLKSMEIWCEVAVRR
jgi:iron complex outermembrane receptor protein